MSENVSLNTSKSGFSKVVLTVAIILIVGLAGFGTWQFNVLHQKKQEIAALQTEKVGFISARDSLNSYIGEVSGTIDEIGAKLKDVRDQQVQLSLLVKETEKNPDKKALIMDDITAIETQLQQDKRDVEDLKARMQKSAYRIRALEKMVAGIQKEIEQNQVTIAELRNTLSQKEHVLNETRDSLSYSQKVLLSTESRLQETEKTLTDTRNAAYYVIGSAKELEERKVIDRIGFFFKKPALSSEFDNSSFTRIDITKVTDLPIDCNAKDVKVVPPRLPGSYRIDQVENSKSVLKVLAQEQFWQVPYLAIVTK